MFCWRRKHLSCCLTLRIVLYYTHCSKKFVNFTEQLWQPCNIKMFCKNHSFCNYHIYRNAESFCKIYCFCKKPTRNKPCFFTDVPANFTEIFCKFSKMCISPKIQFRLHRPIGLPPYPNREPIGYHAAASLQASVITCGSASQATNPVRPEISFTELPFVLNRKSTKHKFQVL
jgi:hypothetical protein